MINEGSTNVPVCEFSLAKQGCIISQKYALVFRYSGKICFLSLM
jgi:hypothetical protein